MLERGVDRIRQCPHSLLELTLLERGVDRIRQNVLSLLQLAVLDRGVDRIRQSVLTVYWSWQCWTEELTELDKVSSQFAGAGSLGQRSWQD